jgi:CBS domain-containing protein
MEIGKLMTKDVKVININKSIRDAAQIMKEQNCGSLPVEENKRLKGMVTDRDITLWLADSKRKSASDTSVHECMNTDVKYCYEDDNVDAVTENMAKNKYRRMPIMDREKKLVGIVSLGDIAAQKSGHSPLEKAYQRICQ